MCASDEEEEKIQTTRGLNFTLLTSVAIYKIESKEI